MRGQSKGRNQGYDSLHPRRRIPLGGSTRHLCRLRRQGAARSHLVEGILNDERGATSDELQIKRARDGQITAFTHGFARSCGDLDGREPALQLLVARRSSLLAPGNTVTDSFHYKDGRLYCEGVTADEIVAMHGTPLYVYSRQSIEQRYRELDDAFSSVDRLIAYSVKANGNLSILRVLSRIGAGADIVSGGELH